MTAAGSKKLLLHEPLVVLIDRSEIIRSIERITANREGRKGGMV